MLGTHGTPGMPPPEDPAFVFEEITSIMRALGGGGIIPFAYACMLSTWFLGARKEGETCQGGAYNNAARNNSGHFQN